MTVTRDILNYYKIGRTDYPLMSAVFEYTYSDNHKQCQKGIAECAYYYTHGELPMWATVIERVEVIEGEPIFIHADESRFL